MKLGKQRGFAGMATVLIGSLIVVFIFALIALALMPSLANSSVLATSNANVAAAPGAVPMIGLTTTILAVIIILTLIGAMGIGYGASRR